MDPERAHSYRHQQAYPDPAHSPMRQRPLGRGELDDAEREGGHRGERMQRDRCRGMEQRRKVHDGPSRINRPRVSEQMAANANTINIASHQNQFRNWMKRFYEMIS